MSNQLYSMPGNQAIGYFCVKPLILLVPGCTFFFYPVPYHCCINSYTSYTFPFYRFCGSTIYITVQRCFYISVSRPNNLYRCQSHSKTVRYAIYFNITSVTSHLSSIEESGGNLGHLKQHLPPLMVQANNFSVNIFNQP